MGSGAPHAARGQEAWLFGRSIDLFVGCGLGYLVAIPPLIYYGLATGTTDWPVLFIVAASMLLNAPHYGATLLRVYDEREERRRYAFFAVWVTAALAATLFWASHSVLVTSAGQAFACGGNQYGQCDLPAAPDGDPKISKPLLKETLRTSGMKSGCDISD